MLKTLLKKVVGSRHEREAKRRSVRRPGDVHSGCALRVRLGRVDVGPCGRVEDEVDVIS